MFSPRVPRAKRLKNRVRIPLQTPTEPQLTWFFVAMGNTQGSRGFIFILLIGKQARTTSPLASPPAFFFFRGKESSQLGRRARSHASSGSGTCLTALTHSTRVIMAEAPATMVTDTQVVVNVEGPAVAGEGARTFFAVSLMCWRKSPLAAPGVALAGATGATGARGSGLRGPFHP